MGKDIRETFSHRVQSFSFSGFCYSPISSLPLRALSTFPLQHSVWHLFQCHSIGNSAVQVGVTDQTEPRRQFFSSEEIFNIAKCYLQRSLLFLSFINPPKHLIPAPLSFPAGRACLCLEQRKVHNNILLIHQRPWYSHTCWFLISIK